MQGQYRARLCPIDHQNRVVSDGHPNRRDWLTLAFLCLAIWIQTVDATVVNIALPEIGESLNATNADLQWVMDAFNVALAGVILLGSGLADRFGRKRICELGIVLFAFSSVAAALSANIQQLLVSRVVMGVATALVLPASFSILTVTFSGAARRKAVAIWSATAGLGIALGPVVGGLLLAVFEWPSVFWLNVPAAVLAAIGVGVMARESYAPGTARLDLVGGLLSVVGLGGLVFAIIEGPAQGWTQPAVLVSLLAGVLGLVLFVLWELRAERPMFQVRVLKHPTVAVCGLALLLASYGCFALFYLVPQYLLYGHGMSVQVVGIAMLPMGLGFAVGSPFCPRFVPGWVDDLAYGQSVERPDVCRARAGWPGAGRTPVILAKRSTAAGLYRWVDMHRRAVVRGNHRSTSRSSSRGRLSSQSGGPPSWSCAGRCSGGQHCHVRIHSRSERGPRRSQQRHFSSATVAAGSRERGTEPADWHCHATRHCCRRRLLQRGSNESVGICHRDPGRGRPLMGGTQGPLTDWQLTLTRLGNRSWFPRRVGMWSDTSTSTQTTRSRERSGKWSTSCVTAGSLLTRPTPPMRWGASWATLRASPV